MLPLSIILVLKQLLVSYLIHIDIFGRGFQPLFVDRFYLIEVGSFKSNIIMFKVHVGKIFPVLQAKKIIFNSFPRLLRSHHCHYG